MQSRRTLLKQAAILPLTFAPLAISNFAKDHLQDDNVNFVGPKSGYSPQIGTLVSMMNWMRETILYPVQGMSTKDLDYLHDDQANSVGAMLWHLAATEKFYQENTFENKSWDAWISDAKNDWVLPMNLGDDARAKIKGNPLNFYLDKLEGVRTETLNALKKRDDDWLLKLDESWAWGPTNNYCKWFHVVEHESNHNGQIKWIKGRIPA